MGISPDMLVCRSQKPVDNVRKKKISTFCNVLPESIFSAHDAQTVYEVPLILEEQQMSKKLMDFFGVTDSLPELDKWKGLVSKIKNPEKNVKIAMVTKYIKTGSFSLADSYVSVNEALKHAGAHTGTRVEIEWLDSDKVLEDTSVLKNFSGVIVPGGFGSKGIEGKIAAAKYCRENNIPYLGLCLGLQVAVIDFARNVCGLSNANSTEFESKTPNPVIDILPEQNDILKNSRYGASMRLGNYPAVLKEGSRTKKLYSKDVVIRRHRHRYEVNPVYHKALQDGGMVFSGMSPDNRLVEFIEYPDHKFFFATQAHPEFSSRFECPEQLFLGFVKACSA